MKNKAMMPEEAAQYDRDIRTESYYHAWLGTLPDMSRTAAKRFHDVSLANRTPAQRAEMEEMLGMTPAEYAKLLAADLTDCFTQWEEVEEAVWEEYKCPSYEEQEIRHMVGQYLDAAERLDAAEAKKRSKKKAA